MIPFKKLSKIRRVYHTLMCFPLSSLAVAFALYSIVCCVSGPVVWVSKVLLVMYMLREFSDYTFYVFTHQHDFKYMPLPQEKDDE